MDNLSKTEKELLIDMADSFIANVGSSIAKIQKQDERETVKNVLKDALTLSDKIKNIKTK